MKHTRSQFWPPLAGQHFLLGNAANIEAADRIENQRSNSFFYLQNYQQATQRNYLGSVLHNATRPEEKNFKVFPKRSHYNNLQTSESGPATGSIYITLFRFVCIQNHICALCSTLTDWHPLTHTRTQTPWSTRTHLKSLTYGPLRMKPERFHRSARQTDLRTPCQIGTMQYKTDLISIVFLISRKQKNNDNNNPYIYTYIKKKNRNLCYRVGTNASNFSHQFF